MDLFEPVRPTVLIVDDVPDNRSVVTGVLQDWYTIRSVDSGHSAITLVHELRAFSKPKRKPGSYC